METIIKQLHWRYAVKKYDSTKKLAMEQVQLLKDVIQLAPSSFGLQPFGVVFVEDPKTREKLRQASFNQSQITDASALVVFAIENRIDEAYIDEYFVRLCQVRKLPLEGGLQKHRDSIVASVLRNGPDELRAWSTHQAYLTLGFMLFAAAELGIDANPMEGFNAAGYDEILGLQELGLSAVVIAAIGYRHPEDFFQRQLKVRKGADQLFIQR